MSIHWKAETEPLFFHQQRQQKFDPFSYSLNPAENSQRRNYVNQQFHLSNHTYSKYDQQVQTYEDHITERNSNLSLPPIK